MTKKFQLPSRAAAFARRFRRNEEGVVLIDAAFAISLLCLFLVGVADLGNSYMRKMTMMNAVRAGSQLALVRTPALDPSADEVSAITSINEIKAAVLDAAPWLEEDPGEDLSVELSCSCADGTATVCYSDPGSGASPSCSDPRAYITVGLTHYHEFLLPYPAVGGGVQLSASNSVRVK